MIRSSNPALNSKTFADLPAIQETRDAMTVRGTAVKTGLLTLILLTSAAIAWNVLVTRAPEQITPWLIGGALGGFVLAMVIIFKRTLAPVLSPVYAACEGIVLGVISALMERRFPGIVISAVGLTVGTLVALLALYVSGTIRATEKFKLGVFSATMGIAVYYGLTMLLGMFGIHLPLVHDSGMLGIGFSLFVVVIAALNLVLDFDFIEQGAKQGAPKYMEWYGAFGLMVTLVWLYLEILRLLSKLRDRR